VRAEILGWELQGVRRRLFTDRHRRLCPRWEALGLVVAVHGIEECGCGVHMRFGYVCCGKRRESRGTVKRLYELLSGVLEEDIEGHLGETALRLCSQDGVALCSNQHPRSLQDRPNHHTFPDPVTPRVASSPSRPWCPLAPTTPSIMGTTPMPLKRSSCFASSSNTCVKANRSTARLRLSVVGGLIVMCVGWLASGSSTVRKRIAGFDGRKRR
jgi:hypothetical protein